MQRAAWLGQAGIMSLATHPIRIRSADHGAVLKIGVQNIVRDVEIGMTAGIVLVILDLLLGGVDLRHRVKACPACRSLLNPQDRQNAVEPLMGCGLVLGPCAGRADHHGQDREGK